MAYNEDEYLQLSGIQHFRFCRRQWALIHIENLWAENVRTVDGELMHERAHDSGLREKRAGVIVTRDLAISSQTLGASGACDVVEFRKSADGIPLPGEEGRFLPYPVEFKHGSPREDLANELQRHFRTAPHRCAAYGRAWSAQCSTGRYTAYPRS